MRRLRGIVMCAGLCGLLFGSCKCRPEELNDLRAVVAVTPNPVDFLLRQVNANTSLPAVVSNLGTADLAVNSLSVEPAGAPYSVTLPAGVSLPFYLPPGAQQAITLVFHPTARGAAAGVLVVQSNDKDHGRFEVPLLGVGGPPRIRVTPEVLNFDLVNQGASQTRTLAIENTGLDTLHVSAVALDPSSNPVFTLVPTNNFGSGDIETGTPALTSVAVVSTVSGPAQGVLHIFSDADGTPDKTVTLVATANLGPAVKVVEMVTRQADYRSDLYVTVTLDSHETADAELDPFSLVWRVLERPLGSQSILGPNGFDAQREIYIDQVGTYRVQVTGTDTRGAVGVGVATIRAIRDLALRLTWQPDPAAPCNAATLPDRVCGQTDVDLHLVAPGGTLGDYFFGCGAIPGCDAHCRPTVAGAVCKSRGLDCTYANRNPDWGVLTAAEDDPRQDIDDARGYGPENISLNNPVEGDYVVEVHFCNDRLQNEGAVAKVEVLFHGVPADPPWLGPVTFPSQGSVWLAATVHYNPNAVAPAPRFTLTPLGTVQNPVMVDGAPNLCTQ